MSIKRERTEKSRRENFPQFFFSVSLILKASIPSKRHIAKKYQKSESLCVNLDNLWLYREAQSEIWLLNGKYRIISMPVLIYCIYSIDFSLLCVENKVISLRHKKNRSSYSTSVSVTAIKFYFLWKWWKIYVHVHVHIHIKSEIYAHKNKLRLTCEGSKWKFSKFFHFS